MKITDIKGGRKVIVVFNTDTESGEKLAALLGKEVKLFFHKHDECMICDTEGAFVSKDGGMALCFEHLHKVDWIESVRRK